MARTPSTPPPAPPAPDPQAPQPPPAPPAQAVPPGHVALRAPEGVTAASWGGQQFAVEAGSLVVPEEAAGVLASHGFTRAEG